MFYVHSKHVRPDGTHDTMRTVSCESRETDAPRYFTASGYGRRIPTRTMVRFNGRWRRVYCCIYSNAGTCYIGTLGGSEIHIVMEG